ncbi:hypothetical protein M5G07_06870 [Serratia symbiotica]|nr:hypothetical protein [Serratia symbiotica]
MDCVENALLSWEDMLAAAPKLDVGWLLKIRAYYNEIDSNAARWLSNLIDARHTQKDFLF